MKTSRAAMDADRRLDPFTPAVLQQHFVSEHAKWFTNFYAAGIAYAQAKLKEYADFLIAAPGFEDLSPNKKASINAVSANPATYCPNNFVHP